MQFIVTALDGKDEKALERRLAAREEHLKSANQMYEKGNLLYAAAILNDESKMIGSTMIFEFPSREDLDKWLKVEPYVIGKVWEDIDIKNCQVASLGR